MRLYLDMDGVLTDCHYAAINYHYPEFDWHGHPWPMGQHTQGLLQALWGRPASWLPRAEFWATFDEYFWASLPKSQLCEPLLDIAEHHMGKDNVWILTRATMNPGCWSGKYTWILENLPSWIHEQVRIVTDDKAALARYNTILVDDGPENTKPWAEAGGVALLVPRPWNNHEHNDTGVLATLPGVLRDAKIAIQMEGRLHRRCVSS